MVTALLQLVIVVLTGSVALLADTIHNFSDALTAIPLFIAFRLGRRPRTGATPMATGGPRTSPACSCWPMITLSALVAAYEAIDRLINPRDVDDVGWARPPPGSSASSATSWSRSTGSAKGTPIGSAALVADGYHARTDGFTSLAVALGAVGVWAASIAPTRSSA